MLYKFITFTQVSNIQIYAYLHIFIDSIVCLLKILGVTRFEIRSDTWDLQTLLSNTYLLYWSSNSKII